MFRPIFLHFSKILQNYNIFRYKKNVGQPFLIYWLKINIESGFSAQPTELLSTWDYSEKYTNNVQISLYHVDLDAILAFSHKGCPYIACRLVQQSKAPQRQELSACIFRIITDDVSVLHILHLLQSFLLATYLKGVFTNLEV